MFEDTADKPIGDAPLGTNMTPNADGTNETGIEEGRLASGLRPSH